MTPAQVDECSLWQFAMFVDGVIRKHNGGKASVAPPTNDEFEQAVLELQMQSENQGAG